MAPGGRARGGNEEPADNADRRQDPIVDRLKPDPSKPVAPALTLTGFLGESDRPGFQRLYFTAGLDYYAEFRSEDVLHTARIPVEQAPFVGEEATRISIRRDASVDYTRTRTARPLDEFDLDVRLQTRRLYRSRRGLNPDLYTRENEFPSCPSCYTNCLYQSCETCHTGCEEHTCGIEHTCVPLLCDEVYTDICVSRIEGACVGQ